MNRPEFVIPVLPVGTRSSLNQIETSSAPGPYRSQERTDDIIPGRTTVMSANTSTPMPSIFSPLARTLLDSFGEGVVVFDAQGRVIYLNQPAKDALADKLDLTMSAKELMPELAQLGGRLSSLRVGGLDLGEAVFLPRHEGPTTLAEREKDAIVRSLNAHGWRLAETAKSLGISRTTLWRRLRAYGLHRDGRSRIAQAS